MLDFVGKCSYGFEKGGLSMVKDFDGGIMLNGEGFNGVVLNIFG